MSNIEGFEALLKKGQDNALLRYTLGTLHLQKGAPQLAVPHLRAALKHDPGYSAAWRALGKALTETGDTHEAIEVYTRGIEVARARGDQQAAKEMQVFLKRLRKA